ncbi:GNAT family N-acetyltransferase [Streptomyces sp. NBC_01261]|uniref:GNAT family N-acetyltransferase n=1 Tax=Streptomyces sp. NBC_01261 TaxID=2903802 RepID=UPI002E36A9CB|nr:GNAT family N-acetyltransferase [Streptomyces sp. NBC_01261]
MTAQIYRDAWGIPHLRADSADELARAQGRVTALDRGRQIEVERHRAQGTSASFLGVHALPWDLFARRARLDDTARRCFEALERRDPETARWVRAYVDGVNEGLGVGTSGSGGDEGAVSGPASASVAGMGDASLSGLGGTGVPASGSGGTGTHTSGSDRAGTLTSGAGGTGVPASGSGGTGTPTSGSDRAGTLTSGAGGTGVPASGLDGTGTPTSGPDRTGTPTSGAGGTGVLASGSGGMDISASGAGSADIFAAGPDRAGTPTSGTDRTVTSAPTPDKTVTPAPEFANSGPAPAHWAPWTPLGIWLATHILFAGFPAKLWREEAIRHLGADAVGLFATDGPGTSGSNGWLVGGERTATGRAVLAGDPHRFIEDPGVYQQVHLSCPEFDVVGLAVPGVPGIAHFGHTGTVAWAITNAMADYQDLYRERLRRTGAGVEALGPDGSWRRAARHTEIIEVAGEAPVEVEVIETERGPVVIGGPEGLDGGIVGEPVGLDGGIVGRVEGLDGGIVGEPVGLDGGISAPPDTPPLAVSLRYPPRVTDDLGFTALLPLLRARQVADVDRAFDDWAEPVNVVQAADTEGGLLHRVAGRVPIRAEANRTRLVPAWEPGHEWHGWHQPPRGHLTDDGIAVMANQRGPATPLGVEFAPSHRADRITALLAEREKWSAADMPAIHMDTHLGSATPLLDHLTALTNLTPEASALRDRLLAWDRRMDADSTDAAAYAAVRGAVVRRLAAHPAFAALAEPPAYPEVFAPWLALLPRVAFALEHLLSARELYGIDRPEIVRAAVEEAAAEPVGTWGDTHRLAPWRAFGGTPTPGPGLSGDHDCVLCTSAVPGLTDLSARGPAARFVWDLARREDSLWVVPLGASGMPGSPHHRDQLPLWLKGDLVPVVTDLARLELHEETAPVREHVHSQHITGFGTIRILPLDPVADAGTIHRWVSEERAAFWGMNGLTQAQVTEIYAHMDTLDTHHAHLVRLNSEPVALLQTYDPAADRVGDCYAVAPGDIGIHLLLAPAGPDGDRPGWSATLMGVLASYVLLGLDRRRVVVDPDVRNEKAIARFLRQGFVAGPRVVLPEVDIPDVFLPEKHAQLAFLPREVAFP